MAHETDANPCHTPGQPHAFELTLRRHFTAPPEKVWRAWMEPGLLKQWFCPKPWYVSEAVIEPRPGGAFNTVMNGPDGEVMPNSGVILAIEPNRRLVTTDALTTEWKPTSLPFMVAEVILTPALDGGTNYLAAARHWSAAAMKQHQDMGFDEGWNAAADQLALLLETF